MFLSNNSRQNSPAKDTARADPRDIFNSSVWPTSRNLERAKTFARCSSIARNNHLSVGTGGEADDDCACDLPAFEVGVCMEGGTTTASGFFRG